MRVTAKVKQQTRERILAAARKLFEEKGFEDTTTRDIAARAQIAAGTLFNYFPTKEALAMALAGGCFEAASEEFRQRLRGDEALDERLFAYIATSLRHLRPHRPYVVRLLEGSLSSFAAPAAEASGGGRVSHLETVKELLTANGAGEQGRQPSIVTLHLYWTLFLGILAYWAADESPHQEDTLVLLDQSMKLFVNSLSAEAAPSGR